MYSKLQPLLSIEILDICDNPIADIPSVIEEIMVVMPNLRDLRLNLYDEDHVDIIMRKMP